MLSFFGILGVGSIVAGLIAWRTAISNHRQAWINDLRDDLATYLKELENIHSVIGDLLSAIGDVVELEKKKREARLAILFIYSRDCQEFGVWAGG